jgi:superfamily II DNA or RNA helicase/HKD family nuclease
MTHLHLPYVIDNQSHKLSDILNAVMREHHQCSLDVATAYFSVSAFRLLREQLGTLRSFRLLLGFQPAEGKDIGLRANGRVLAQSLRADLEGEAFNEHTLRLVEDLIAFLRQGKVGVRLYEDGFLHAKCYLFYGDKGSQVPMFDRFLPLIGIVGSSNFTGPGLSTNKELNLAHKTLLDPEEINDGQARASAERLVGQRASQNISNANRQLLKSEVGARAILDLVTWYEGQWEQAREFKDELIELLDASKFGAKEYTPFDVYLKAIYTYFQDELDTSEPPGVRSAVELSEFQDDAVKKARRILAKYDGVLVGDSVGMGKTWIGKKLLEDFAYHQRMKALVVCPAALREMWQRELASATISAQVVSQEAFGQANGNVDLSEFDDADVILIDESHNFRNSGSQRYLNLEHSIAQNRGRGRSGGRKKLILLTATPISNGIFDLYNQLALFTRNDRGYFAGAGIGDLYRYFLSARQQSRDDQAGVALFNLLEEVVIRRTRPFIRQAYPNATIRGKPVHWPERRLHTLNYDLEATYDGIYDKIMSGVDRLSLAHYNLESFKRQGVKRDELEEGREQALVGIFKSRYLKRFESSVEAFRISIRRALAFIKTFEEILLGGRVLDSRSFNKAMQYLAREDEEDDATPGSAADDFDANDEAREFVAALPTLDTAQYELRKLHHAIQQDVEILTDIWHVIKDIRPEQDAKLAKLKSLLAGELRGKKVLLFTYYRDTARFLYRALGSDNTAAWRRSIGNPTIRRIDSGAHTHDRTKLIQHFSPLSNEKPEIAGSPDEIDILISTDVLSEGQNLQDCGVLLNYDLHWNPTRMVQRAGRIDRIGSEHATVSIYNMFPDKGLERLLGLVESLSRKIAEIDATGFLDASVLGETVHPRNFNTLKRIRAEDGAVVEEQEKFVELASSEFLLQQLKGLLASGAQERLDALPDGIHSGLPKSGNRGLFFYFTAPDPAFGARDPVVGAHGGAPSDRAPSGRAPSDRAPLPDPPDTGRRQHFWRYYDLLTNTIVDNRFVISNLIACSPDTPRVMGEADVFAIQAKVQADILKSVQEQAAVEAAPTIVEPIQQTVSAVLRQHLNNPAVPRRDVVAALSTLSHPATRRTRQRLKFAYETFVVDSDVAQLLAAVSPSPAIENKPESSPSDATNPPLTPDDLHLVCWEYVWS